MNLDCRKYLCAHPGCLLLALVLCLVAAPALSLPVQGLYQHDVAVADQSEAERRRAFREALEQVIVKVSGQLQFLQQVAVRSALASAADYVEEVSYRTELVPVTDEAGLVSSRQQGVLQVRFAREAVDTLLRNAGIPVWDHNRPSVLVWISLQHADGRRELLSSGSDHALLAQLRAFSQQRAIPMLVPILDLTDRQALPLEQAWRLDTDVLRQASARYQVDSVLAGRVMVTPAGDVAALWQFLFRDEIDSFDQLADGFDGYMEVPLDHATVRLARHFALPAEALASRQSVTLRVDGVAGVQAYAALLQYLEGLALVHDSRVSRLAADRVELVVEAAGGADRLSEFISLDRDLEPLNFLLGEVGDRELLHYRWTRR